MEYTDTFKIDATLVANEFLEKYMPKANGDYVKVYLYLLRNSQGGTNIDRIAESLELTEGDVSRALKYWQKKGILQMPEAAEAGPGKKTSDAGRRLETAEGPELLYGSETAGEIAETGEHAVTGVISEAAVTPETGGPVRSELSGTRQGTEKTVSRKKSATAEIKTMRDGQNCAGSDASDGTDALRDSYRSAGGKEKISRLSGDEDFNQLLMIVQKYLSKILNDSEQQVFAYLYDGLKMPAEVLDYLVDFCVSRDHRELRYIEKVGLDWHAHGVTDLESAKKRTESFGRKTQQPKRNSASAARTAAAGISRGTDYDALLLEQVIRKME